MKRKVAGLDLQLMMFIYQHKKCAVMWAEKSFKEFSLSNGVGQGAVLSNPLYGTYQRVTNYLEEI